MGSCPRRPAVCGGARKPDDGSHYYEHWLAALEKLVANKGVVPEEELERRANEWDAAARATPHGKAVELHR
jgi:hypothetical protein